MLHVIVSTLLLSLNLAFFTAAEGPCDIYGRYNTPCVAAHSMVRALYGNYNGPLYQVLRKDDNATLDIHVLSSGGFANSAAQDSFCSRSTCVVKIIYDQSPMQNHLEPAPAGGAVHHPDNPVTANRHRVTVGGHPVYAAYFEGGMGYRNDRTKGIATGNNPETLYMVTSGTHYNGGCCFDYGNAEVNNDDDGAGTMECVFWGNTTIWGRGQGSGPWVMADLENGLWAGNVRSNDKNLPIRTEYVTAMVKGGTNDATSGKLQLMYDGPRPNGYQPMRKQGAIILGIGGDNSDSSIGTFYEGVMTTGYSTDAADDAVQANIVAAGYGK
eukprot:TRINITY_DN290_c0_g1_i5.p1 TRINITY_DN290_c0_g1~~TRINITY_DN290_c0_g1_i5.p1  ORF type:complete len:326 (-),score=61.20 TRINITY_DN290_c0_g1_i5:117-1094(-)